MASQSGDTICNDEESTKDLSFSVLEKVENATQIDDHNVCISTQETEKNGLIEAVDHNVRIFTESTSICFCNFLCEFVFL